MSTGEIEKENLKREIGFLLIAAQNNSIRKNYVNVKSDNMQQQM